MLARRSSQLNTIPRRTVVVFSLVDRRFALPAERVVEVAKVSGYTPLPCENAAHLGVVYHRETVIPLVDVGRLMGVRGLASFPSPGLCFFCRTERGEIAFPVDRIFGLAPVVDEQVTPCITIPGGIPMYSADAWETPRGQAADR